MQRPSVVLFVQGGVASRCLHQQALPREIRSLVCSVLSPAKNIYQSQDVNGRQ